MPLLPAPKEMHTVPGVSPARGFTATNAGPFAEERLALRSLGALSVQADGLYYAVIAAQADVTLPDLPAVLRRPGREEGFFLSADEGLVCVLSAHPRGVLYGLHAYEQTLADDGSFCGTVIDYPDTAFRAFHMDMRYGFPSVSRMLAILEELSAARFNTFLLEYENRFPFEAYPDIADPAHFTPADLRRIQERAAALHIELIPLQQTIGHLEYMLKLPRYHHLREMREFPETPLPYSFGPTGFKHYNHIDEICASSDEACSVVETLLDEVMAAHPASRYVHLGCDEAWNLLSCPDCLARYGENGKNRLYLGHINRLAARALAAGKTPIVWDDMLRSFSDEELELLDKRVVVMIWLYYESNYALAVKLARRFKQAGFTVLGAAAAKCGEGPEPQYLDMPWYELRLGNVDMWGRVCAEEGLDGFCMTVWSNYSGTIAPPHPFFDTVWYPVLFAAEKLWNRQAVRDGFDTRFAAAFFGVAEEALFHGPTADRYARIERVSRLAKRHRYEAEALRVMELTSVYRLKALTIGRELYKLRMPVTDAEKTIVRNRAAEVAALRELLKPQVRRIVETHYTKDDADVFVRSRFDADEALFRAFLDGKDES